MCDAGRCGWVIVDGDVFERTCRFESCLLHHMEQWRNWQTRKKCPLHSLSASHHLKSTMCGSMDAGSRSALMSRGLSKGRFQVRVLSVSNCFRCIIRAALTIESSLYGSSDVGYLNAQAFRGFESRRLLFMEVWLSGRKQPLIPHHPYSNLKLSQRRSKGRGYRS
jgi:hypothetical protein